MPEPTTSLPCRRFDFERDTFAFANELVWEYTFVPGGTRPQVRRNDPAPDYAHRCFVLTRAARLFHYHARFDPAAGALEDGDYALLIHRVLSRHPRVPGAPEDRVVIPGFASLRTFSRDRAALLKSHCGGAWRSYFLRSHWRMVFPISRGHQERTATGLVHRVREGVAPLVHLVLFPQLTINHGLVVFDVRETPATWEFAAYDPNIPDHPVSLTYHRDQRQFEFPANHYWAGGRLNVIEILRNWWI